MAARSKDAGILILMAVVEVILTEAAIRSGLSGVERATTILFILIMLNFALVVGIGRRRNQVEQ
jgi:Ca2+/H+ antiporter